MQSAGIYLFLHPHTHIPPYFSLSIYLLRFASSSRLRGIQGSSPLPSREKRFSFQLVATRLFIALPVPRRSLPRWRKQEEMLSAFHIYKRVNIYPRRIASSFFFFYFPVTSHPIISTKLFRTPHKLHPIFFSFFFHSRPRLRRPEHSRALVKTFDRYSFEIRSGEEGNDIGGKLKAK